MRHEHKENQSYDCPAYLAFINPLIKPVLPLVVAAEDSGYPMHNRKAIIKITASVLS